MGLANVLHVPHVGAVLAKSPGGPSVAGLPGPGLVDGSVPRIWRAFLIGSALPRRRFRATHLESVLLRLLDVPGAVSAPRIWSLGGNSRFRF